VAALAVRCIKDTAFSLDKNRYLDILILEILKILLFKEAKHMTTTANRWGASLGIRLTKPVLETFTIDDTTLLELDVKQDRIIITRAKIQPKVTLEELFENFNGRYEMTDELKEWEQMRPAGSELL
jgi:antitoxin component of MazEF toxin-antitoxin module